MTFSIISLLRTKATNGNGELEMTNRLFNGLMGFATPIKSVVTVLLVRV